jgi:hypothetical protein
MHCGRRGWATTSRERGNWRLVAGGATLYTSRGPWSDRGVGRCSEVKGAFLWSLSWVRDDRNLEIAPLSVSTGTAGKACPWMTRGRG